MAAALAKSSQDEGVKPFITKLHAMVSDPTTDEYFRFTPDGSGLTILNIERFVSEMLPLYFKHSNLSSFVRQLNTYGFSKVDHGDGPYIYAHPDFHRDFPERLALIQRKSSHSTSNTRVGGSGHLPGMGSTQGTAYFDSDDNPLILHPGIAGGQPSMEATDEKSLRELRTIVATMRKMDDRIGELTDEVKVARNQQLETHQTMGKLMDFLSVIYNEHKVANVVGEAASKGPPLTSSFCGLGGGSTVGPPIDVSEEAVRRAEKRQRLSHSDGGERKAQGVGSPPPVELLAPLAKEAAIGALSPVPPGQLPIVQPPQQPRVRSISPPKPLTGSLPSPTAARNLQLQHAQSLAPPLSVPLAVGTPPPLGWDAPSLAPQISLARSTSLGAHVALAMPSDLREFALGELAGSTDLQDQAIKGVQAEANASMAVQQALGRPVTEADAEDFLWDFLEASQDMSNPSQLS